MLNYNFVDKQIIVSDDVEKIAELTKKRIAVKSKYMARILAAYDKAGSIENFMENFSDVSGNISGNAIKDALDICVNDGYYDIDENFFLEDGRQEFIFDPMFNELEDLFGAYKNIIQQNEDEHEYREQRKENRGRFVGGGFGLGGAISGSLKAGALNMATGLGHSVFNSIGNAMSNYEASKKLKELYELPQCRDILLNAVNILVNNIWLIMINDVYQLSIAADQEMKKSEAIFNNVINGRIPKEKTKAALLDVLSINPLKGQAYDELVEYLDQDELEELLSMYNSLEICYLVAEDDLAEYVKQGLVGKTLLLKIQADGGNPESKLKYVKHCIKTNENVEDAIHIMQELIEMKYERALFYMAKAIEDGEWPFPNQEESLLVAYKALIILGYKGCYLKLAELYRYGRGNINADNAMALEYYFGVINETKIKLSADAYKYIFDNCFNEKVNEKLRTKAFKCLDNLLNSDETDEQLGINGKFREYLLLLKGRAYALGLGCKADTDIAVECYKKLIQEDKPDYASPNETMAIVGLCEIAHKKTIEGVDWELLYNKACKAAVQNKKSAGMYAKGLMLAYKFCKASEEISNPLQLVEIFANCKYVDPIKDEKVDPGLANKYYYTALALAAYLPVQAKAYYAKAIKAGLQADAYPAIPEYDEKEILSFDYPLDKDPAKIPQFEKIINDSLTDKKVSIKTCEAIAKCCALHNLGYEINVDWQQVYVVLDSFYREDKTKDDVCNATGMTRYCIGLLIDSRLKQDEDLKSLYDNATVYFSGVRKLGNNVGCMQDAGKHATYCEVGWRLLLNLTVSKEALEAAQKIAQELHLDASMIEARLIELSHVAVPASTEVTAPEQMQQTDNTEQVVAMQQTDDTEQVTAAQQAFNVEQVAVVEQTGNAEQVAAMQQADDKTNKSTNVGCGMYLSILFYLWGGIKAWNAGGFIFTTLSVIAFFMFISTIGYIYQVKTGKADPDDE
ncbi:hypothetical protein [Phascolarctobacterium succinatutens]|uniref:hypothetical protein n=1 Tax=Phascolarctobacterium succinatutens TaxID=626940 RepID=UPI003FD77585